MRGGTFVRFLKELIKHPSALYLFILPIYIPLRSLAEAINHFEDVMSNDLIRVEFFVSMIMIVSVSSIILFLHAHIVRRQKLSPRMRECLTKTITFFCFIGVTSTSYTLLHSPHEIVLYFTIGAHFLMLSYMGNFVIQGSGRYRLRYISCDDSVMNKKISNNILSMNIAVLSFVVTLLFVVMLNLNKQALIGFIVLIEVLGAIYFYHRYRVGKELRIFIRNARKKIVIKYLLMLFIGFMVITWIAYMLYDIPLYIASTIIFISIAACYILSKKTKPTYVLIHFNGGVVYGFVLCVLLSSVLLFFIPNDRLEVYEWIYVFEPIVELLICIGFVMLIKRNIIKSDEANLYRYVGYLSVFVLIFLTAIYALESYRYLLVPALILIFFIYALIEYVVEFTIRQIMYQHVGEKEKDTKDQLNYLSFVISQGFVPSVIYVTIHVSSKYFNLDFNNTIMSCLYVMAVFAFVINITSTVYLKKSC